MGGGEIGKKTTLDYFLEMVRENGCLEFTRRDMEWGDTLVVSEDEFMEEMGDG